MKKIFILLSLILFLETMVSPVSALNTENSEFQLPDVNSETAVLMDANTGQILFQKEIDKKMYPASITKIMTGILALKYGELSDIITISQDSLSSVESDSANISLFSEEQITLEQALYALSVASANDAANVIAESIGGTRDYFVEMMNTAAKTAGAMNTHFENPDGMPNKNQFTTARDMALITAQALNTPGFAEIFNTRRYEMPPTNKQPETRIFNSSNSFIDGAISYEGTLMSKAGWTVDAQHTLVTAARRGDTTLIAVVMKSADSTVKWSDTVALLDYGFTQFKTAVIPKENILQVMPVELKLPSDETKKIDPTTYVTQDASILLPVGKSVEDVKYSLGLPRLEANDQVSIPVFMSLYPTNTPYGPIEIYKTTVQASLQPPSKEIDVNIDTVKPLSDSSKGVLKDVQIVFVTIFGGLFGIFGLLLIRRIIIISKRKRRRTYSGKSHRSRY